MNRLLSSTIPEMFKGFSEPPRVISEEDYPDFYGIVVSALNGILVNLILLIIFVIEGGYFLASLSITGIIFWLTAMRFAYSGHFSAAIFVGMFEMMFHVGVVVSVIGLAYGGQLILWASIAYAAFSYHKNKMITRIVSYACLIEMAALYAFVPQFTEFTAFENYREFIFVLLTLCSAIPLMTVLMFIKSVQIRDRKQLQNHANFDPLTGLFNRGFFDTLLEYDRDTLSNGGGPFCVCLADIDYFKKVNDEYGHDVGDEVLIEVANIISGNLRKSDAVCRWGGEEFAIILRRCDMSDGPQVIQKIRKTIASKVLSSAEIKVTMSFGLILAEQDEATDALIKRADRLLYTAKENGRNQLVSG
ncbi:GGDEF domain-containing protein [Glaciecola sp. MH2013]|uniref:GGDEF domain-containing protein n=1 Tax=Glaciecola sp. MH2013 TaxID=2785524 RepID=UPI00189E90C8|nr:GGDEF domain-containing protein [Glaciecola sp. MH2013]MBF7074473.1 GGDEF domain-containing protein [Glaciecola sp. MH2013]